MNNTSKDFIRFLFLIFFFQSSVAGAQSDSFLIDISRQTSKKVRLALPRFAKIPDMKSPAGLEAEARNILKRDLLYSELFQIEPLAQFQSLAQKDNAPSQIKYDAWRNKGAHWVIKAQYGKSPKEDKLVFVFRIFDAVNRRFVIGKRYRGRRSLLRRMMHRFADEVVEQLTGKRGIADTRIAFVERKEQAKEIYVIDYDGKNKKKITSDDSIALKPTWSPNGRRLVFTSFVKHNPDLVMVDLTSKRRWPILTLPGLNAAPAWSPDGSKIAVVLSRDQNSEIYYFTKRRKLKRLTRHFTIDTSPTWSPDGKQIAFTSDRSGVGAPQIYIMDTREGDQGTVRRITSSSSYNDNPAWSPDGTKIAYTARVGKKFQIKIHDLTSGETENFTSGPGNNEEPSWSPDGRYIIYRNHHRKKYVLTIKRLGSAVTRQLSTLSVDQYHPSWSPYLKK